MIFGGGNKSVLNEIEPAKNYRRNLLKQLQTEQENEMFKNNSIPQGNQDPLEDQLARAMAGQELSATTSRDKIETIPQGLIARHEAQIKDLTAQADDYAREAKRLNTLEAEARLGIKALEAANKVLKQPAYLPDQGVEGSALPQIKAGELES